MILPEEIFDSLIGRWSIERLVHDYAKGIDSASMTGTGIFKLIDPDMADYHEAMAVRLTEGPQLDATRDYTFRRLANGFSTYFKDTSQLFHNMEFFRNDGALAALADHLCADDKYESAYHFADRSRFEVIHKVFGPRKSYQIHSLYSRAD